MKVVLLQDVAKIGRRNAVVEVPDGFARNRLIPMKQALPATKDNLARVLQQKAHAEESKRHEAATVAASLTSLSASPLTIKVEANEKGHLFKGVTKDMIAAATEANSTPLPAAALVLSTPIKDVGEHEVGVSLLGVTGTFTITVARK